MLYDFGIPSKDLNGNNEPGNRTLRDILREFLGTETSKEHMVKICYWYRSLLGEGKTTLELDEIDRDALYNVVFNSERLYPFVKIQLQAILKPS